MAQDHAAPATQRGSYRPGRGCAPGIDLQINGEYYRHTGDPQMPLLWYLRDVLRLDWHQIRRRAR